MAATYQLKHNGNTREEPVETSNMPRQMKLQKKELHGLILLDLQPFSNVTHDRQSLRNPTHVKSTILVAIFGNEVRSDVM